MCPQHAMIKHPKDHTSDAKYAVPPSSISGATYPRVPHRWVRRIDDSPIGISCAYSKSMSFTSPEEATTTFSGFTSK